MEKINYDEIINELFKDSELENKSDDVDIHNSDVEVTQEILDLVSEPGYPLDFPKAIELQKLKNTYRDIYFVSVGSLAELYLGSKNKNFIVRHITRADIADYISMELNLRDTAALDSFIVERCTLFPKLDKEYISKMCFGAFETLVNQIKLHSKLETTVNVTKV